MNRILTSAERELIWSHLDIGLFENNDTASVGIYHLKL